MTDLRPVFGTLAKCHHNQKIDTGILQEVYTVRE